MSEKRKILITREMSTEVEVVWDDYVEAFERGELADFLDPYVSDMDVLSTTVDDGEEEFELYE